MFQVVTIGYAKTQLVRASRSGLCPAAWPRPEHAPARLHAAASGEGAAHAACPVLPWTCGGAKSSTSSQEAGSFDHGVETRGWSSAVLAAVRQLGGREGCGRCGFKVTVTGVCCAWFWWEGVWTVG